VSETEAVAPLSVATEDLTLTVGDLRLPVASTGERLFVEVPTVRAALRLARLASADAERPAALLTATGLTAELRVRGRTVAVLGGDARPGPLSRTLGVAPAVVRAGGCLTAAGAGAVAAVRGLRRRL
jgi:hypothetical protein